MDLGLKVSGLGCSNSDIEAGTLFSQELSWVLFSGQGLSAESCPDKRGFQNGPTRGLSKVFWAFSNARSFPTQSRFQPGVVSRAGLTLLEVRTSYLAGPLRLTPVRLETDMFQISACLLPVSRVADFPVRSVQHRTSVSLSWLTLKWIARTARPRSRLTQLPE